jgi:hypothetical protein
MSRLFALLLAATPVLVVLGCSARSADGMDPEYQKKADEAPWEWSEREASLVHSITEHLRGYCEVELLCPKEGGWGRDSLTIRLKDKERELYAFKGHWETVFTRWQDSLYVAEFNPIATGCSVKAVDLKTGKQLWRSHLKGSSCPAHSEYRNQVTIGTDGKIITVRGNESWSRYIEFLDIRTGKTLGHHEYK